MSPSQNKDVEMDTSGSREAHPLKVSHEPDTPPHKKWSIRCRKDLLQVNSEITLLDNETGAKASDTTLPYGSTEITLLDNETGAKASDTTLPYGSTEITLLDNETGAKASDTTLPYGSTEITLLDNETGAKASDTTLPYGSTLCNIAVPQTPAVETITLVVIDQEDNGEHIEEKRKELKRKQNNARQRAYYERQINLKEKIKKVPKSNAERQRKFRQRNAEISYMDMSLLKERIPLPNTNEATRIQGRPRKHLKSILEERLLVQNTNENKRKPEKPRKKRRAMTKVAAPAPVKEPKITIPSSKTIQRRKSEQMRVEKLNFERIYLPAQTSPVLEVEFETSSDRTLTCSEGEFELSITPPDIQRELEIEIKPKMVIELSDSDDELIDRNPSSKEDARNLPPGGDQRKKKKKDDTPQLGSASMNTFHWKDMPLTSNPIENRRGKFIRTNYGPTRQYINPYDAFVDIWDLNFMNNIVNHTNRYAQKKINWKDTDADEMYLYFALVLAMGVVLKTNIEEYWQGDDIFSTPEFAKVMTYARFAQISQYLTFGDISIHLQNSSRSKELLHSIKPIVDHLNKAFQKLFNIGRNLVIDEMLSQKRGNTSLNQFISQDAAKKGIRTYEISDSLSGYHWKLDAQISKTIAAQNPTSGDGDNAVLRLLEGLNNKGYTVWMGSELNSPALARKLKSIGFDCVGMLNMKMPSIPHQLSILENEDAQKVRGYTSGDVDLISHHWRKGEPVGFISTFHGGVTTTVEGNTFPIVASKYKGSVASVNRRDQLIDMYPIERIQKDAWYKKFFRRLLNLSVFNAHVLQNNNINLTGINNESHRNFRKTLIRVILKKHTVQR